MKLAYRPEIDGLRALAVIPVILYHAGIPFLKGGFLGVDVFFVLSGFLITSIIYKEKSESRFSFVKFYDRRIRRILPSLLLTGYLTIVLCVNFTPEDMKNVGQSFIATFLFASNYFFYLETDYFNQFNQVSPMLHTWSLSLEEQFYLIVPFIIVAISKLNKLKYMVLVILMVLSFCFCFVLVQTNPNLAFYSLHTRGWELLFGSILAFFNVDSKIRYSKYFSELISSVGAILIIAPYFFVNQSHLHPSWITSIPILGTGMVIYFSQNTFIFKNLLSNKILLNIGLSSYSLYLFHNPIFAFIDYYFKNYDVLLKLLSIPLVFVLAFFSTKLVEKKIRDPNLVKPQFFYPIGILFSTLIIGAGYLAHSTKGFYSYQLRKYKNKNLPVLVDVEQERVLINNFRQKINAYPSDLPFESVQGDHTNVLLIGDSLSEDAYLSLLSLQLENYKFRRIYFDDEEFGTFDVASCSGSRGSQKVDLTLLKSTDILIIAAKWQISTYNKCLEMADSIQKNYVSNVFVAGNVMFENINSIAMKAFNQSVPLNDFPNFIYRNQRFDRVRISDELKSSVEMNGNIKWIEKFDFFCNDQSQECQLFDPLGNVLIWDNAHLTLHAYEPYGLFLLSHIEKLN